MNIIQPILVTILLSFASQVFAQELNATSFDFWVGKWTATWKNPDGTTANATNTIEKTLNGTVLQEHFNDPNSGFKGTSISVFNPKTNEWHQAWADNQGGYYDFIGETIGAKKIFKTQPVTKDDTVYIQRMVFYDITHTSLTWDWESTIDGGKTWTLNWRVNYTRK